jgi:HAD superfamily hydrolase (TIGR01549 family)
LADGGYGEPPPTVEKSPDPFDVLNYAASLGATENAYVNAALTAMESEIIQMATPTQGAHDLIKAWFQTGRPLAIVSNNSTLAIEAYLDLHGLRSFVAFLSGRTEPNPALLKPSPHLIIEAISELGIVAESTVFIGDSSADMLAAQAAGVSFIGYTEKFGKAAKFRELGVTMTTKTMELSV